MSQWADKFIIGLTGNIGTGKSVVRRMLEQLGALGIDADELSHKVIRKSATGYQPVVDLFGISVLGNDREIDRAKLAAIVFKNNNEEALRQLETIIHPLVNEAIQQLIRKSSQTVVVIEAIKLIEVGWANECDSIWVTVAPPPVQVDRLVRNRHIAPKDALLRIAAQSPQEQKTAAANLVIQNDRTINETWQIVAEAWEKMVPKSARQKELLK